MQASVSLRMLCVCALVALAAMSCNLNKAAPTAPTAPIPTQALPITGATAAPEFTGDVPGELPDKRADQAGDVNSSVDANKKSVPGGDVFVAGLYERPFNAQTMDTYFPYLDIVDTQGYKDDTWGYATITLVDTDTNGKLPGTYGVELDLNRDGRGDWLILAAAPSSTDWTTQGVKAWKDTNADMGGVKPLVADRNVPTGNGYETLVFDQGQGDLQDGAWVRISSQDKKTVQLAFKLSMLGDAKSFAMGAWAGRDALNPADFDFNDHMSHAQAGSPLPSYQVYPLKGLAEVDNTCRLAIGFAATGKEPGLCKTIQLHGPGDTPPTPAPRPTQIPVPG